MAAIDAALTEAQARHPHWDTWVSSEGRYWATRRSNIRFTKRAHRGWEADSLAESETRIKAQEEYEQA